MPRANRVTNLLRLDRGKNARPLAATIELVSAQKFRSTFSTFMAMLTSHSRRKRSGALRSKISLLPKKLSQPLRPHPLDATVQCTKVCKHSLDVHGGVKTTIVSQASGALRSTNSLLPKKLGELRPRP